MNIRAPIQTEIHPLAEELAELPLLRRYRLSANRLSSELITALKQGDGLRILEDGGRPRGLAWFLTSGTFATGGYLKLIAIASDFQQKGAGAALLAAFEDAASEKCRNAFLLVSDFNTGAQRFYERHGYGRVGGLPGLILPDVIELIYWKRLGSGNGMTN